MNTLKQLLVALAGDAESSYLFEVLQVPASLENDQQTVTRAQIAQALSMLLFHDLLARVPEAKAYADEVRQDGRKILLDHGALRTVALSQQSLPSGQLAFQRILEPLGYTLAGRYPLDRLKMCGFVYTHQDYPEDIAQYFVSELYPERFSAHFQETVCDVLASAKDPLTDEASALLGTLKAHGALSYDQSLALLKVLPRCFDRHHRMPTLEQYKALLAESAEMAWISTEGNAYNHATDRVQHLDELAEAQRLKGRPMKPQIEEGRNANIRQTAYRAASVVRSFTGPEGSLQRDVPGSFFEFIERGQVIDPASGKAQLDLRFDSQNAQGIFKMTR